MAPSVVGNSSVSLVGLLSWEASKGVSRSCRVWKCLFPPNTLLWGHLVFLKWNVLLDVGSPAAERNPLKSKSAMNKKLLDDSLQS